MSQILSLHKALCDKKISATQLAKAYIDAIEKDNQTLGAYVCKTAQTALEMAKKVDQQIAAGQKIDVLAGLPMTLKDNMSTKGIPTTCCSKILSGYVPIYDASVYTALKKCGAPLLGKTNMDEFAMGSSCETSCFGGAKNPHNLAHVAGGSSGGVASAVAGNLAVYGLGSDTGGSIRQPASFCGLVGLKPTYGAVSRYGLIAYASSLDQIGPITTDVTDASLVFDAISGKDPMDTTSMGAKEKTFPHLQEQLKGKKIGIADEYFQGLTPDVLAALNQAIQTYTDMGCEIVRVSLPALKYALPVYYILACAEASSNLGRFDGIRYGYRASSYSSVEEMVLKTRSEGFGPEVQRRILLGSYVLSAGYFDAYYKRAQDLRGAIIQGFDQIFDRCDVLLAPTVPMSAFLFGFTGGDPVQTYLTDICTVPINIAGLPSVSVPCGFDHQGLPIGMQLIGKKFGESEILNAAYQFESFTNRAFLRKTAFGADLGLEG